MFIALTMDFLKIGMPVSAQPMRFLLVEDDDDHADLIIRSLKEYRVANELFHVSDGEQALAFLRRQGTHKAAPRPDVVLLDLKLPKVDGHEVLTAIKSDAALACIPVVVLTTSSAEMDMAKAFAAHANSYVVKPIDFNRFNELVQALGYYWAVVNRVQQ